MKEAKVPGFVKQVFEQSAGESKVMTPAAFGEFLESFQGQTGVDENKALDIICKVSGSGSATGLDLLAFFRYLLHPGFNAAMDTSKQPSQDMTAPLSHYYINTSHNSYLRGNQLTSKSCSSPIISALTKGCRVVELDCWEYKNKVMVFHGGTLTKAVPFEACVAAIKEHAFTASEFPVIVTIENHLPPALQQEAAKILHEIIGDALYIPPKEALPREFLSPWELRRKIIISDKPPKERISEQVVTDPEGAVEALAPDKAKHTSSSSSGSEVGGTSSSEDGDVSSQAISRAAAAMASAHLNESHKDETEEVIPKVPELQNLLYIYCAKPSEMETAPVDGELVAGEGAIMANMSEPQLKKSIQTNPSSLIQYTKMNLGRMYPFGLRFDSSNADPMLAWSHGFQLAAVNFQGRDRPCWVAQGFFLANGRCGYVRKPDCFLSDSHVSSSAVKLVLKVRVLSGTDWHKHFDLLSKPDFYVKIAIHGSGPDKAKMRTQVCRKTKHPSWENETFEFPLTVPEIAVLRFEVWEHDRMRRDDFVGQACIPIQEIEQGIRVVMLRSKRGTAKSSKLLCHFELTT